MEKYVTIKMMDYQVKLELQRQNKSLENLLKKVEVIEKKIDPKVQLLASTEVCKQLLVSERTLAQWRKDKEIDYVKIGNIIRYTQKSVNDLIKRSNIKFSKN